MSRGDYYDGDSYGNRSQWLLHVDKREFDGICRDSSLSHMGPGLSGRHKRDLAYSVATKIETGIAVLVVLLIVLIIGRLFGRNLGLLDPPGQGL